MASGYDKQEINIRFIGGLLLGFLIVLAVVLVFIDGYYTKEAEAAIYATNVPVSEKLLTLHTKEEKILNTYGVIDAGQGIYRIPIDRAMTLTAQEAN